MDNTPQQPLTPVRLMAFLLIVGLSSPVLVSCNTTAGLGRDMQKVGDKIEDEANRHR